MRKQLRPFYTKEQLAKVYNRTYDHSRWLCHIERIAETVAMLDAFAIQLQARSVADLSCGDGAVVEKSRYPWGTKLLGDYVSTGPIELAVRELEPDSIDVFVLSETLEHVEDPLQLLKDIRRVAKGLVLTTPHGETNSANPEHYWGWDANGIQELLTEANWQRSHFQLYTPPSDDYYTFQFWTCT